VVISGEPQNRNYSLREINIRANFFKHFELVLVVLGMKNWIGLIAGIAFSAIFTASSFAQDAHDLIMQGNQLHGQRKFDEAIAKYNEALKAEPENATANYEIAYTLYDAKKPEAAIPYLEKVTKSPQMGLVEAAYCLMGSIYDDGHQPQKAIDAFNAAIKIGPNYPQVFFNLGIAEFRDNRFAEAEQAAIEAMKRAPNNASDQRLYALVTFHQDKRGNALLALCSFLLIEPTGPRAVEAYNNIQSILKGGVLKQGNGNMTIQASANADKDASTLNTGITLTAASAAGKKLQGNELLAYDLKNIFALAGQLAEKKTDKNFFDKFFAAYLYKLAQSDQANTLVEIVAAAANQQNAAKWQEDNKAKADALKEWMKNMPREF